MSLKTELQGAIDYCNTALVNKGADEASTVYEIGDMIDTIQQGGTPTGYNWEDIKTMTLNNPSSAPTSYEITIPPYMTDLSSLFTPSNLRGADVTIHKTGGSDITSLAQCFRYLSSGRTITLDFDTSHVTSWDRCFSRAGAGSLRVSLTIVGTLDFTSATNVSDMFSDYLYDANHVTTFEVAEGTLSKSWNIGNIYPSDSTLASIVAGLKDLTGGTAQTLSMNANTKARLTQTQLDAISAKNWLLA